MSVGFLGHIGTTSSRPTSVDRGQAQPRRHTRYFCRQKHPNLHRIQVPRAPAPVVAMPIQLSTMPIWLYTSGDRAVHGTDLADHWVRCSKSLTEKLRAGEARAHTPNWKATQEAGRAI